MTLLVAKPAEKSTSAPRLKDHARECLAPHPRLDGHPPEHRATASGQPIKPHVGKQRVGESPRGMLNSDEIPIDGQYFVRSEPHPL